MQCLGALSDTDPPNEDDAVKIADAIVACHIKEGNIQNAIEYLNALLKKSTENRQQKLVSSCALFPLVKPIFGLLRFSSATRASCWLENTSEMVGP